MKLYFNFYFITVLFASSFFNTSCKQNSKSDHTSYFTNKNKGIQTGGVKLIPITTPKGNYNVWTKTIGHNPTKRLLLLNGGPGMTHEYFECFESFLPEEGVEIIYYDQLGCGFSDNPKDTSMWDLARYVDEVEQVRKALDLGKDDFYLLGHSWGGILCMEYALKYQENLKGLIISNMMSDAPEYGKYADDVLAKMMEPKILDTIRMIEAKEDYANPKYMDLLNQHFYTKHILRLPSDVWPEPVNRSFGRLNQSLYVTMQGPSEFGIAGKLEKWSVKNRLKEIKVPTLVIGARHDTMDPEHMKWMAEEINGGTYLYCGKGSHMCMYDDQEAYFKGLKDFLLRQK